MRLNTCKILAILFALNVTLSHAEGGLQETLKHLKGEPEIVLAIEFLDQLFKSAATFKDNLKKKSIQELVESQRAISTVAKNPNAQNVVANFFSINALAVQADLQTIASSIASIIEEKKSKQTPTLPVISSPAISATKIPIAKVNNLATFIEPSVKRGRLFDFNYLSLPQLKEMQQAANEVYADGNSLHYIAEKLGSDLQSVKISLSSLIGQLPHQIVQKESAEKKEKQMQAPRRWSP